MKEMTFGKQLRKLRTQRGLSQVEVAKRLELKQNTLSHYENGKSYPDMATLLKIADYFNVSLDELVYTIDEESQQEFNKNEELFIDLEKGLSIEEMAEKYNFIVDGEQLPKESIEKVLDQIKYEYYKMKKII